MRKKTGIEKPELSWELFPSDEEQRAENCEEGFLPLSESTPRDTKLGPIYISIYSRMYLENLAQRYVWRELRVFRRQKCEIKRYFSYWEVLEVTASSGIKAKEARGSPSLLNAVATKFKIQNHPPLCLRQRLSRSKHKTVELQHLTFLPSFHRLDFSCRWSFPEKPGNRLLQFRISYEQICIKLKGKILWYYVHILL